MIFTNNEIEVVKILLKAERPLTCADIIANSANKTWKDRSIYLLINTLLEKNAIEEAGFVRTGRTYGRTFAVTNIGKEAYLNEAINFIDKTDTIELMSALFDKKEIDLDTIQNLEELIKKRKGNLQ